MKTLELNLPTPVLLVWGLPEDARAFHIEDSKLFYLSDFMVLRDIRAFRVLPEGNWQLIGKLSELTEEQAMELFMEAQSKTLPGNTLIFKKFREP